jgi:pSer/pThr/pTyr-binding forkhead associated (FHA) protein
MARLILRSAGKLQEQAFELKPGVNRLGRGSANDHPLPYPEISEVHCELLVENDFVFVRDLASSNGTFIDGDLIQESALYAGQALQIGPLELVLDAPPVRLVLPELPKPESIAVPAPVPLADGYPSCLGHAKRHAIWECPHCTRAYCDECIRKLRRVGGVHLRLCPACSTPCRFTAWSEMMRKKKKGFFGKIVGKLASGFKRTTRRLDPPPPKH